MIRNFFNYSLLFLMAIGFQPNAQAVASDTLRVHITVFKASMSGTDFDLDNDAYRDQLIQLFSYSSYHQIQKLFVDLKKSARIPVDLMGDYKLLLNFQGNDQNRHMIEALIRSKDKNYVTTVLAVPEQGAVFLGGPPYEDGVLILALETGY